MVRLPASLTVEEEVEMEYVGVGVRGISAMPASTYSY